ncbi:MAG TPA: phosphoribosyltransferase family protein [Candidatus Nitrosopolaris sp.]|nr:phosphoribosyltransferase family protein [Candidatus Nitrosopolaris sp.]
MKFNGEINEETAPKEYCSWEEVELLITVVAEMLKKSNKKYEVILGITNGGIIPARLLARELDIDRIQFIPIRDKKLQRDEMPKLFKDKKYLIADDIYDTGNTFHTVYDFLKVNCDFAFLMCRYQQNNSILAGKILNHEKWIVFPWERRHRKR